jgi:hypothetical protein
MPGTVEARERTHQSAAELWTPQPISVGYWKRAKWHGDLTFMTNLSGFEVRRADVEKAVADEGSRADGSHTGAGKRERKVRAVAAPARA